MNRPGSPRRVVVGLIDSGFNATAGSRTSVLATRRFVASSDGVVQTEPADADALGHGSTIAEILLQDNPGVDLLVAQVLDEQGRSSPPQVAAALDWLLTQGAAVINLSFGVLRPDAQLRLACERAATHSLLVSSAPARGAPSFPASYSFCIAVSGDARCGPDQISWLGTATADFGAHPFAPADNPQNGGASYAAARMSARIARLLSEGVAVPEVRARLLAQCRYQGPERKHMHPAATAVTVDPIATRQ